MIFAPASPATALGLWDMVKENQSVYLVSIEGKGPLPPWNPFESPGIEEIYITYPYNETHERVVYCYNDGIIHEKILPKCPKCNQTLFNITAWNTTKVLEEYQWGLENYLPTLPNNWSNHITDWVLLMDESSVVIRLYQDYISTSAYVLFECHNPSNVTCEWNPPKLKIPPPYPTATTSTTNPRQEDKKTCGPALLVGLTLAPLTLRWKRRGM
ncbi:CGP-CTERM sorting domain-containing protein [Thermococcus camini]|nr:CGP-CTERM sorting domain-containing protein [Thermococcus camini]